MRALFRRIQFSITFAMTVVALSAMVLVSLLVYDKVVRSMRDTLSMNSAQMISQAASTVNVYVQDMMDITDQIISGIDIYTHQNEQLQEPLNAIQQVRGDVASLAIVNSRGAFVAYAPTQSVIKENVDILSQEWFFPDQAGGRRLLFFSPPCAEPL